MFCFHQNEPLGHKLSSLKKHYTFVYPYVQNKFAVLVFCIYV